MCKNVTKPVNKLAAGSSGSMRTSATRAPDEIDDSLPHLALHAVVLMRLTTHYSCLHAGVQHPQAI